MISRGVIVQKVSCKVRIDEPIVHPGGLAGDCITCKSEMTFYVTLSRPKSPAIAVVPSFPVPPVRRAVTCPDAKRQTKSNTQKIKHDSFLSGCGDSIDKF